MPSPTTPVLDNFNRANEDPLSGGGNWADGGLALPLQLLGNAAANGSHATSSISRWNAASFNADQEAYVTRTVIGTTVPSDIGVVCRHSSSAGKYTGLLASIIQPNPSPGGKTWLPILGVGGASGASFAGYVRLSVIVANVNVRIDLVPYTANVGAVLWQKCVGPQISIYVDNGIGFELVINTTDSTILTAGRIALYAAENTPRADDFGGGNV